MISNPIYGKIKHVPNHQPGMIYPLVNVYITLENHVVFFLGKSSTTMAMASIANCFFVYQRVAL